MAILECVHISISDQTEADWWPEFRPLRSITSSTCDLVARQEKQTTVTTNREPARIFLWLRYVSLCVKLHKWLTDNMDVAECGAWFASAASIHQEHPPASATGV